MTYIAMTATTKKGGLMRVTNSFILKMKKKIWNYHILIHITKLS